MTVERDILCPLTYQNESKCIPYFYSTFNDIRYDLYKYMDLNIKFKDGIYEIDKIYDPILRHIALYLVENYYSSKKYFSNDGTWRNNYACESLNKWLENKKSYFTHAFHCKGNVQLWDKTIEPLWKKLEEKFKNENGSEKKWCERYNFFIGQLQLPKELYPPTCYKHVPKGYQCVRPFPPNMCNLKSECTKVKAYYEKCKGTNVNGGNVSFLRSTFAKDITNGVSPLKSIQDVTFTRQVQKNCECSSLEYATPISFTPLGSKLSYRGINKKRLRDNFNEELEYEEYASSMNKNPHHGRRRNNIYYDSVRN